MTKWILPIVVALASLLAGINLTLAQSIDQAAGQAYENGRAAAARRDYSTALAHFQRASAEPRIAAFAFLQIGLIKEQTGERPAAMDAFLEVTQAGLGRYERDPNIVRAREAAMERLNQYAYELLGNKEYAAAERLFAPGVEMKRTQAIHGLTVALLEQGKLRSAETHAERLLNNQPMNLAGFTLLYQVRMRRAELAAQDPQQQDSVELNRSLAQHVQERANALPMGMENLRLARENGRVVVEATVIGNAAPAGHFCIAGFKVRGTSSELTAGTTFNAPAKGEKLTIQAPTYGREEEQQFVDIHYQLVHCEPPGAAAAMPPEAKPASFDACPKDIFAVRKLLEGREPVGSRLDDYGQPEHVVPAGGIKVFGKPVTRLASSEGSGILYELGLPGTIADYKERFKNIYADRSPTCGDNYCGAVSRTENLGSADLVVKEVPGGLVDKGVYLACLYRRG